MLEHDQSIVPLLQVARIPSNCSLSLSLSYQSLQLQLKHQLFTVSSTPPWLSPEESIFSLKLHGSCHASIFYHGMRICTRPFTGPERPPVIGGQNTSRMNRITATLNWIAPACQMRFLCTLYGQPVIPSIAVIWWREESGGRCMIGIQSMFHNVRSIQDSLRYGPFKKNGSSFLNQC